MKKLLLIPALAFIAAMAACETEAEAGHMAQMDILKDSIMSAVPTTAAITLSVQNDELLIITLGDPTLYSADAAERQKTASRLGAMARRIFGRESRLKQAKLIITANETNQKAEPEDGIVTEIALPEQ